MPAAKPRRTESEPVRRAQLLKAARKVFRAKGYDRASVSEIVREAGVAQGTFYLYFPSKRAAAISLRDGLMEIMAEAAATAVKAHTSFENRLRSLIAAGFKVARRNPDLLQLTFIGADETHPEMHSESQEHAPILRALTDLFRGAVDTGEMEPMDPELARAVGNWPASACHGGGLCLWRWRRVEPARTRRFRIASERAKTKNRLVFAD